MCGENWRSGQPFTIVSTKHPLLCSNPCAVVGCRVLHMAWCCCWWWWECVVRCGGRRRRRGEEVGGWRFAPTQATSQFPYTMGPPWAINGVIWYPDSIHVHRRRMNTQGCEGGEMGRNGKLGAPPPILPPSVIFAISSGMPNHNASRRAEARDGGQIQNLLDEVQ